MSFCWNHIIINIIFFFKYYLHSHMINKTFPSNRSFQKIINLSLKCCTTSCITSLWFDVASCCFTPFFWSRSIKNELYWADTWKLFVLGLKNVFVIIKEINRFTRLKTLKSFGKWYYLWESLISWIVQDLYRLRTERYIDDMNQSCRIPVQ